MHHAKAPPGEAHRVRPAAVAGRFYPGRPAALAAAVEALLADAARPAAAGGLPPPKAIIAPHAGYVYSGPIAAAAYARLRPVAALIRRVVLLGPCHRVAIRGLAAPDADAFGTPLGEVPVDAAGIDAVLALPSVQPLAAAHAHEHALEVHLPFLQVLLPAFRLVPLAVGDACPAEVAAVLERLWGGPETLIVVSSDLSHYLPYDEARVLDARTCRAIERLDGDAIDEHQACGRRPVAGLLLAARRRGLRVTTLDLRNSGDTAGDRGRVVGYGAWMLTESAAAGHRPDAGDGAADDGRAAATAALAALVGAHGGTLLATAARSIAHGLVHGRPLAPPPAADAGLGADGASFVTLHRHGALRGCVGTADAYRPLLDDVARNAFAAAFRDPRFPPLAADERDDLDLKVSVLSPPAPLAFADEAGLRAQLRPGEDGLVIESGGHRALFLPDVWQTLPDPAGFLAQLKRKAGLDAAGPAAGLRAWRFATCARAGRLAPALAGGD
jgi:AmmeMemoRadiSam system protein B/AmmeMemoRadiSam system protein A